MLVDDLDLPPTCTRCSAGRDRALSANCSQYTTKQLMGVPGLGQKSLEEIRRQIVRYGGWALAGDEAATEDDEGPSSVPGVRLWTRRTSLSWVAISPDDVKLS